MIQYNKNSEQSHFEAMDIVWCRNGWEDWVQMLYIDTNRVCELQNWKKHHKYNFIKRGDKVVDFINWYPEDFFAVLEKIRKEG